VFLVGGSRDLDDNVYFRDHDWRTKRFSRRRFLRRKDFSLTGMFREMYRRLRFQIRHSCTPAPATSSRSHPTRSVVSP
jgi:hypothetical protein